MNKYFEEIKETNKNKYLTLVPANDNKLKKDKELCSRIRDLIRSVTKSSEDFDEKNMKTKINLNDKLSLNRTVEIYSMIIVVTAVFMKINFIDKLS